MPSSKSHKTPSLTLHAFAASLLALLVGCTAIPKAPLTGGTRIPVGPGTEDIVLDDFGDRPRLLISCEDRRHGDSAYFSAIVSYDLQSGQVDTLSRRECPADMRFGPHGLDLVQVGDRLHLYVVCHDERARKHWVACFQVVGDELYWIRNYESPLLTSPNAVTALPDGSLYVTNDHQVRGSFKETFLRQKIAKIIHFNYDGKAQVAYDGLAYGNGITQRNGYVYAAATRGDAVFRLKMMPDGTLTEPTAIAKLKGPDNLRWDGDDLLVAAHLRSFAFLRHAKDARKHSPSVIYRIKPGQMKPVPIYAEKGEGISAAATGLAYKGRLYIGGVFDGWILVAE